jgi:hypothetical protein
VYFTVMSKFWDFFFIYLIKVTKKGWDFACTGTLDFFWLVGPYPQFLQVGWNVLTVRIHWHIVELTLLLHIIIIIIFMIVLIRIPNIKMAMYKITRKRLKIVTTKPTHYIDDMITVLNFQLLIFTWLYLSWWNWE